MHDEQPLIGEGLEDIENIPAESGNERVQRLRSSLICSASLELVLGGLTGGTLASFAYDDSVTYPDHCLPLVVWTLIIACYYLVVAVFNLVFCAYLLFNTNLMNLNCIKSFIFVRKLTGEGFQSCLHFVLIAGYAVIYQSTDPKLCQPLARVAYIYLLIVYILIVLFVAVFVCVVFNELRVYSQRELLRNRYGEVLEELEELQAHIEVEQNNVNLDDGVASDQFQSA